MTNRRFGVYKLPRCQSVIGKVTQNNQQEKEQQRTNKNKQATNKNSKKQPSTNNKQSLYIQANTSWCFSSMLLGSSHVEPEEVALLGKRIVLNEVKLMLIVDGRNPATHLGCIKPCK